jgi:hypothetical protein
MKKIVAFLALFVGVSFAQGNNNGVGLWLSNYGWGFDLKHLNNNNTAWDVYLGGGLGFSSRGYTSIGLDVGYYFLFPNMSKADAATVGKFPLHWGPNFGFGYWSGGDTPYRNRNLLIAPNVALGISWFVPTSFKWDVSLELFPGLRIMRVSNERDSGSWDSEMEFSLGVDLRLLFHFYLF